MAGSKLSVFSVSRPDGTPKSPLELLASMAQYLEELAACYPEGSVERDKWSKMAAECRKALEPYTPPGVN